MGKFRIYSVLRIFWATINYLLSWLQLLFFFIKYFFCGPQLGFLYLKSLNTRSVLLILKTGGAKIGKNVKIGSGFTIDNAKTFKNLRIGNNVNIGKDCYFDLRNVIRIENNCTISMRCILITHKDLGTSKLNCKSPATSKPITIKENCYIGANVTILNGVTVSSNTIIGASSLVHKSVDGNQILVAEGAKYLRKI